MGKHQETPVEVNAWGEEKDVVRKMVNVDVGIAELVRLFNTDENIMTLFSCQKTVTKHAYVNFIVVKKRPLLCMQWYGAFAEQCCHIHETFPYAGYTFELLWDSIIRRVFPHAVLRFPFQHIPLWEKHVPAIIRRCNAAVAR